MRYQSLQCRRSFGCREWSKPYIKVTYLLVYCLCQLTNKGSKSTAAREKWSHKMKFVKIQLSLVAVIVQHEQVRIDMSGNSTGSITIPRFQESPLQITRSLVKIELKSFSIYQRFLTINLNYCLCISSLLSYINGFWWWPGHKSKLLVSNSLLLLNNSTHFGRFDIWFI